MKQEIETWKKVWIYTGLSTVEEFKTAMEGNGYIVDHEGVTNMLADMVSGENLRSDGLEKLAEVL